MTFVFVGLVSIVFDYISFVDAASTPQPQRGSVGAGQAVDASPKRDMRLARTTGIKYQSDFRRGEHWGI